MRGVPSVTYVRTYLRTENRDTLPIHIIRLSTNDQLIFLPSAKRGVDKKLPSGCKFSFLLNQTLRIFKFCGFSLIIHVSMPEKTVLKTIQQLIYTNVMNPPTLSVKFSRTDVIPDFYSAGLKYGHINEIWPT